MRKTSVWFHWIWCYWMCCSQCERNDPLRTKEGRYGTDSNHGCFPFTAGTDSEKWARAWNTPLRRRRRGPFCYPWPQCSQHWKAWAQNLPVWAPPLDVRWPPPPPALNPSGGPAPGQPASRGGVFRSALGALPQDSRPPGAESLGPHGLPQVLTHSLSCSFERRSPPVSLEQTHLFLGFLRVFSFVFINLVFLHSFAFISSEILCGVLHDYFCCTTRKAG